MAAAELADAQRNASSFIFHHRSAAVRKLDALLEIKQRSFQCQEMTRLAYTLRHLRPGRPRQNLGYVKAVVRSVKVASKRPLTEPPRGSLCTSRRLHDNAKVFPFWAREVLKLILLTLRLWRPDRRDPRAHLRCNL